MDGPREDSINWRESVKKKRQMSLWYHLHVGSKQNERDKRTLKRRWCCESAALNMPENLENSAVATGLEKVSFHSNPKER